MSHKTIYIDVDEEITSVIDRMRKADANEVIIVAPKRALLLQSLVNLKLLKKESERRKGRIMIVTQDKIGKKLIEKAGIMVQGKVDDSMADSGEMEEPVAKRNQSMKNQEIIASLKSEQEDETYGSDSYFDEPLEADAARPIAQSEEELKKNNIDKIQFDVPASTNIENIPPKNGKKNSPKKTKYRDNPDKTTRMSDIVAGPKPKNKGKEKKSAGKKAEEYFEAQKTPVGAGQFYKKSDPDPHFKQRTEKFFGAPSATAEETISRRKAEKLDGVRIKSKVSRYFILFAAALFCLGGLALAYLYLPKARIILFLKSQERSSSADIQADVSASGVEAEKGMVPAKLEQLENEKQGDFTATGSKSGGGKASGKVVIYNDFSAESQTLVATTRLETADGKLFRIIKTIVVPGMTKVGADTKSGAIEADVVADKAGEDYNIDPADFKIPGFKSGPKYDKFYARSAKTMTGGSSTGETAVIMAQDISQAKEKMLAQAKVDAAQDLRQSLPAGRKIFDDGVAVELESAVPSAVAGTETDKFTLSAKVKIKSLSFSEEDVKKIIEANSKNSQDAAEAVNFTSPINYILAEENVDKGYIKFQAKTDLGVAGGIDLENFKKGVLGKTSSEVSAFATAYPAVSREETTFWPFFVNRVPMNENRVEIEVK